MYEILLINDISGQECKQHEARARPQGVGLIGLCLLGRRNSSVEFFLHFNEAHVFG